MRPNSIWNLLRTIHPRAMSLELCHGDVANDRSSSAWHFLCDAIHP